jgi:hypothetical protein
MTNAKKELMIKQKSESHKKGTHMNDMNTYSHSRLIKQPNQYSMFAAN